MKNSTILIVVGIKCEKEDLARKLEAIRAIPAHAAILVVAETPEFPYYSLGVPMYGAINVPTEWQDAVAANTAELSEKTAQIETLLETHGVSGEVTAVASTQSQVSDAIARRAMLCDLALIGDDLRPTDTLFRQSVYGVLLQSPIGVLLNCDKLDIALAPKTVFVAWNTNLHSARAVHQALPLLRAAQEIVIGVVDPVTTEYRDGEDPGVDLAKWLAHHGCNVTVRQYPSGGQEIGEVLLDRSDECGADLIVMGSYGHSRTREAIFGGTTRTLIEQTKQAVLLGH